MSIGSVSGFYMGGRPSGLPNDIEDQIVQARADMVLTPIEQDMQTAKTEKAIYTDLNKQLASLYSAADGLDNASAFSKYTTTTGDNEVVTASTSGSVNEGTYSVSVTNTATAHSHLIGIDDADGGTGVTLGIDDAGDASEINSGVTLSFYHNGTEYSYTTDSETTLNSLAGEINDADNGVQANVSNIGTSETPEYALILKSETTGAGEHRITTDGTESNVGVSFSGGDLFVEGASEQEETQTGVNAVFSVDGVDYERAGNEVDDVLENVTLKLKGAGSDVNVGVSLASNQIMTTINAFVEAFNTTRSFIDQGSAFNPATKKGGPLMGDFIARTTESRIANIAMSKVSGTEHNEYQYLSQVGIQFADDGTLEVDSDTLSAALSSNPDDVQALFTGDDGVAGQIKSFLEGYTDDLDGALTYKIESFDTKIERLQDDYEDAQESLENYRDRLIDKYTAMENAIMQYDAMQNQIDGMMDQWKANMNIKS